MSGVPAISELAVREHLAIILASASFRDSERHRKLLEFLVETTLRGEAGSMKEFVIASEVWGRGTSFDPRTHSTVRVEVGRLRSRLDRYYSTEGSAASVRFSIPTGGYAVVFDPGSPPQEPPDNSRFEILELIGKGGMGEVWKARDRRLDRLVALKFIRSEQATDAHSVEQFEAEARAAAATNHPNICTVYDVGTLDGRPFLAIELLEGETLKQKLEHGLIPLESVVNWAIQISDGLDAAHSVGVVHRDLKPANLFVTNRDQAKILDFGLARLRGAAAAGAAGTVGYMSPEQIDDQGVDVRSDLFAFGAVLYEMVTGRKALPASGSGRDDEACRRSPELERIIHKALENERELRYQHASEIRADLKRLKRDSDSGQTRESPPPARPIQRWPGARRLAVGLTGAALLIAATVLWAWRVLVKPPVIQQVVLSEFVNTTGDPVFNATLRQGLSAQLDQTPFLNLLSDRRIADTLQLMAHSKEETLTPELARQVCARTGSAATIEGSIAKLGSEYVLGLRALACPSGEVLAQDQSTAATKEQVLKTLGEASARLRRKLGESLPSMEKHNVPLDNVTTGSLEALEAYSRGIEATVKGDVAKSIPFYEHAIQLDPQFAMAYARLGRAYWVVGPTVRGLEMTRKAFELRDRVSERERFYIDSHFRHDVEGNLEEERKILELWAHTYPRDPGTAPNQLRIYNGLGDYAKALEAARTQLAYSPDGNALGQMASVLIYMNRLDEAEAALLKARAPGYDSAINDVYRYEIAFLKHDAASMENIAASIRAKPDWESLMFELESFSAGYEGRIAKARELGARAVGINMRVHHAEDAASFEMEGAIREAVVENFAESKRMTLHALSVAGERDQADLALGALALALAGEREQALRISGSLSKTRPDDTLIRINDAQVREAVAYHSRLPDDLRSASEAIAKNEPYDLAGGLVVVPAFTRGLALLGAHDGAGAASAFQRVVDNPGIMRNFVVGSISYLYLGRALKMKGDIAGSRGAYRVFLDLWKNADPDVPALKAAKAEFAALEN
jgi:tetratricopeptide (TPR) repeat protein/tRNA A-37 threonylcarbamoyl transferase component Bud32